MSTFHFKKQKIALALVLLISLQGCDMTENQRKISNDVIEFSNIIIIDYPIKTIQWEIFGTPEYTGGVPGPTDFMTLVAQVSPANEEIFRNLPVNGRTWIAPKAARDWLDPIFRKLLMQHKNTNVGIPDLNNCRAIGGTLRKSKTPVKGFACREQEKALIHIKVADYTKP